MFTAGGSYARLSCRQGTDLWIDMVCKSVPFFMPCSMATGSCSQHIESLNKCRIVLKVFAFRNIIIL